MSTNLRRPAWPARLAPPPAAALGLAFTLALAVAGPAPAQVAAPAPANAQDEEEEVDAAARQPVQNNFAFDDANFDAWIYNGRVVGSGRDWFEVRLTLRLEELDRACTLTDPQKAKIRLAGKGDVKRFFDIYDEKRRKFQLLKTNQGNVNEIFREIAPLQQMLASGAFGRGSIFEKTVKATLSAEQVARFDEVGRDRRAARYRARVDLVVAMVDNSVGLTADQRRRFADVLGAETKAPARTGQYEYYLVMYLAAQLPEEKLRPIFDDVQWKVVGQMLNQAKGYQSFLRTNGLLEDRAAEKPAARAIEKAAGKALAK